MTIEVSLLTIILINLVLSITYFFLRYRETRLNIIGRINQISLILKFIIISLSIISVIILSLISNDITQSSGSLQNPVITNISIPILFLSIILFISTFRISNKYAIELDCPSRVKSKKGTIKIGKVMKNSRVKHNFFLSISDLTQHMFVCGITGTGKSNFIQNFLLNFTKNHEIPFLLNEFKGEYHFLQNVIENLLIIKPGENFSINIFDPEGANSQVHAERIFQIFESGGMFEGVEYSPQMQRVFVDILNEVCLKESNRNWEAFSKIGEKYHIENKDMTVQKSVAAIQNRIRRYFIGTLKDIFAKKMGLNVKELFDYKVLLDLSSIIRLGGEKEDALFFLNMILKYLWDKNLEVGSRNYEGIKHITIIEDAQYFAPEELSNRTKLTSYIEDIALLLRGTGECLISLATRPKISKEILANCGVLVSFQNHMQKEIIQELLNLEERQKEYLSMLQKGQCIVRVNSIERPFLLRTPNIERSWLTDEEISKNNKRILENKLYSLENKIDKKQEEFVMEDFKSNCKVCGKEIKSNLKYCESCSSNMGQDDSFSRLRAYINKIYEEEQKQKS